MFGINSLLEKYYYKRYLNRAFNTNSQTNPYSYFYDYWADKPEWLSLSTPADFEKAARFNPIVKAALNLLATSGSNAKKKLIDSVSGEEIPWTEKSEPIQKLKNLFNRPNPLQSSREFQFQGLFYLKTFGNRYVYNLRPSGFDSQLDLMDIEVMYNLPSQYISVRKTGKLYNQTQLKDIISEYARTDVYPPEKYDPEGIMHFNEVNISSEASTIMGISKLEVLKEPITNTYMCFQAMNTILKSRGMQGIVSIDSRDGQGSIIPLDPKLKKETQKKFKKDYGLLNDQNPFLISPVPIDYIKTIMNSQELGIYQEFSNNSIIIGNEFGIPPELIKTYIQGATYENQLQSVRRLYQDTTIPMINDEDSYWSYRLNTEKYGFVIKSSWDHIPALQDAFKEKAQSINLKGRTAKEAYDLNIITVNQYLELIEQDTIENGDVYKYKWEKDKVLI